VDPGYLDPADREVEIVMQNVKATGCTDILRREHLALAGGAVHLRVPMGSIRVVDIALQL
jgi:lambda-carrageenase